MFERNPADNLELALEKLHDALLTGDKQLISIAEANYAAARKSFHAWVVEEYADDAYFQKLKDFSDNV